MSSFSTILPSRAFEPGTTGWTDRDLDDPEIERHWFRGRHEIVEGVLTTMPPAYFAGGNALFNLLHLVKLHLEETGKQGRFGTEIDIVVDEDRVARADAVMMTPADEARQADAIRHIRPGHDPQRTRIYIPPTLIVESISPGHENHDLKVKRRWYAEFGVPNYWMLNAFTKSLECLVLDRPSYRLDTIADTDKELRPSLFSGLAVRMGKVWED